MEGVRRLLLRTTCAKTNCDDVIGSALMETWYINNALDTPSLYNHGVYNDSSVLAIHGEDSGQMARTQISRIWIAEC